MKTNELVFRNYVKLHRKGHRNDILSEALDVSKAEIMASAVTQP